VDIKSCLLRFTALQSGIAFSRYAAQLALLGIVSALVVEKQKTKLLYGKTCPQYICYEVPLCLLVTL